MANAAVDILASLKYFSFLQDRSFLRVAQSRLREDD
jgi:hypothetical protein